MKTFFTLVLITIITLVHKDVWAQCNAPTAVAFSTTGASCAGYGTITVNSVNEGATVLNLSDCRFVLYDATNTTIIKPEQATPVLGGLDGGNYVLHIHHVCGTSGISADYTQAVQVPGSYQNPVLSTPVVNNATCNDGSISVTASKGNGVYTYCLVNALNDPFIPTGYVRPPQASGTFTGLAAGTYYVRVYDGCIGYVTTPVIVQSIPATLGYTDQYFFLDGCNQLEVWQLVDRNVPIDANNKAWITYPDNSIQMLPAATAATLFDFDIDLSKLTTYPAVVKFTYQNACNNTFTHNYTIMQPSYYLPNFTATNYNCSEGIFYINNAYLKDHNNTLQDGTIAWEYYSLDGGQTWKPYSSSDTIHVPTGGSRQVMYKMCGQTYTTNIAGPTMVPLNMSLTQQSAVACNGNSGIAIWGSPNGSMDQLLVHVTAQPAAQPPIADFYLSNSFGGNTPGAYPYQLLNLAPGTYNFLLTDQCGATQSLSITLTASTQTLTVTPKITCGATQVGLNIKYTTDKNGDLKLWYVIRNSSNQRIDSAYIYASGARSPGGATVVINNLAPDIYTVKVWKVDNAGSFSSDTACGKQIFTVDARLPDPLTLNRSTFALCTNDATAGMITITPTGGIAPYTYTLYKGSISAGNQVGAPQSSNVFTNLDANATYIIGASDLCGSGATYSNIFVNVKPAIFTSSPVVPCLDEAITLWVSKNSGLTYQWLLNGNAIPNATDTSYKINSMAMADSGAYAVNIRANDCLLLSTTANLNPTDCHVPIPLSIDLVSFSGIVNTQGNAVLNWQIARPESNAVFDVLYAADGKNFMKVGSVYEDGLNTKFEFTHTQKITGKGYYKLLMNEKDGKQKYSNVILLQAGKISGNYMTVAPLPFSSFINVNYTALNSGLISFTIMDINGRTLIAKQANLNAGVNMINISGLDILPVGIYLLQAVNAQGEKQILKIQK